jgi:hypothetical protein
LFGIRFFRQQYDQGVSGEGITYGSLIGILRQRAPMEECPAGLKHALIQVKHA